MKPPGTRTTSIVYALKLVLARAALLWELAWPRIWPPLAVVAVFLLVSMTDVLPALPGWLHTILLIAFAAALVWSVLQARRGFRMPTRMAARRRLERDSGFVHRPLTALEDSLAGGAGDPRAVALWREHQERMAEQVGRMRVAAPDAGMPRRDPLGLRVLVVLALLIGLAAGGDAGALVVRALSPSFGSTTVPPVSLDLWITPPAYTRKPPVLLQTAVVPGAAAAAAHAPADAISVPAGSVVLAQVTGGAGAPVLVVGDRTEPFAPIAADTPGTGFRVGTTVERGSVLAVRDRGGLVASWPMTVVPDRAPVIAMAGPPAATPSKLLAFRYDADDDYGLVDVTAVIRPVTGAATPEGERELRLPLPLPDLGPGPVSGGGSQDLTPHVWAGQEVLVHLEAEDAAGQTGVSEIATVVLPEREFKHPVARAVIEQRRHLLTDDDTARLTVAQALGEIAARPQNFANDTVVSLGLSVARARLIHERSAHAVTSVRRLLWDTALRLELGAVPAAEQRLREARQRLWEALRSDTDTGEIERLINELEEALDAYLKALAAEMARRGTPESPPPGSKMLHAQDLKDLIESARQLARSGARDSARRLLSELQHMLDALRDGMPSGANAKDLVKAHELMNDLRTLTADQQKLLDESFERLQALREEAAPGEQKPGRPDREAPAAGQPGAGAQEDLRGQLGELMLRFDEMLGSIPDELGGAERAMKGATQALQDGRLGDAVPRQSEAVERLRRAAEQAAGALAQKLGGFSGMFRGDPDEAEDGDGDPFGRGEEGDEGFGMESVTIPNQSQVRRVEEIMRELRRRAGEFERPEPERDYIRRLLRRF